MNDSDTPARLAAELAPAGLVLRGGFMVDESEAVDFPHAGDGAPARTLLLIGSVGGSLWRAFSRWRDSDPPRARLDDPVDGPLDDPLDAWTRETLEPLARRFGARPIYPFAPPWQPFQQWAMRAQAVHPSPIGILVHPDHGLWHAYRAAFVFSRPLKLEARRERESPCSSCAHKPCLSACPVAAFSPRGYDLAACAGHLEKPESSACHLDGCRARDACPVGRKDRYGEAQRRFHMAAFIRARGIEPQSPTTD